MLVTLARFVDPWEAQVVRARLAADGIPASVAYAHHAVAYWPMSLALGGTAVQVPATFLDRSRTLYSDYETGTLENELHAELGTSRETCPRCGSSDFKRTMAWHKRLLAILIVLVLAPFPARRSRRICHNCGCRWNWGED